MNIYEVLKQGKFSANEQAVIDLVQEDPDVFIAMDVREISNHTHVSRSTIYRLCKKAGTDGLADFKIRLSTDREAFLKTSEKFDFNYPIHGGENGHRIASLLKQDYASTVQAAENLLDYKSLHYTAKWIHDAHITDIYTSAGNICFADNFQFQMSEIARHVNVPHEYYAMNLCATNSDETHTAIVISFGGRAVGIESVCQLLKKNKTKLILISSQQAELLVKYADVRLFMPESEDHYRKVSSFSTRVSLLYLLDILYTAVFALDYEENKRNKTIYYEKMTGRR